MRTIASLGSWIVGSGTVSTRTSRLPCQVRARIPADYHALDLEALVLEVELALDLVHHLVGDRPGVAEADELGALRLEHAAHDHLVLARAVLEAVAVVALAGPRRQAPPPVVVEPAHAVERVLARP